MTIPRMAAGHENSVDSVLKGPQDEKGVDSSGFYDDYEPVVLFPAMYFITFAGALPADNSFTMNFIGLSICEKNIR